MIRVSPDNPEPTVKSELPQVEELGLGMLINGADADIQDTTFHLFSIGFEFQPPLGMTANGKLGFEDSELFLDDAQQVTHLVVGAIP
jgi:hypothetical protein